VPARAPGGPPEIGQSTTVTPRAAIAASISFTNGTPMVQVLTSSFIAAPLSSRSAPNATSRNAARVGSDTNTISHLSAISGGPPGAPRLTLDRPVVGDRPVQRAEVVPDQQVVLAPDIGPAELRLELVREQIVEHLIAFARGQLVDPLRKARVERRAGPVTALRAGFRRWAPPRQGADLSPGAKRAGHGP
jgi:hypothetical protein